MENVDTEDEKALAKRLIAQRDHIVKTQYARGTSKETIGEDDETMRSPDEDKPKVKSKGKTRAFDWGTRTAAAKERKAAADKRRRERIKQKKDEEAVSHIEKLKPSDGDCDAVTPTCKSQLQLSSLIYSSLNSRTSVQ